MVAYAEEGEGETAQRNAIITIDMDSKRVSDTEGEPLFTSEGERTDYLKGIDNLLARLLTGINATEVFIDTIAELNLIELARVEITFADGEHRRYDGLYTIRAGGLNELKGDVLEDLHRKGYLQACYLLLASMGQLQKLVARRNTMIGKGR